MNRRARAALATEMDEIVARGRYTVSGRDIVIEDDVRSAVDGTHLHPPEDPILDTWPPANGAGKIEVTGEPTLVAARRLAAAADDEVACLNFASPKQPGGGYRAGAETQEVTLARSSALAACLAAVPEFYEHHRSQNDLTFSDQVICSPGVPVLRDDDGALLAEPYRVTFLSAAAPNAMALAERGWRGDLRPILGNRIRRVLAAAAVHGHRRLVLGAWGCGLFFNPPELVAEQFALLLSGECASVFDHVTFAVSDVVASAPTRRAFEEYLDPAG
jgi:uncharacterized protein (TIGR02452 family)